MSGIHLTVATSARESVANVSSIDVEDIQIDPTPATASITINPDGTYVGSGNTLAPSGVWKGLSAGGIGANYEVRATGATYSGEPINTWLSLSTARTWSNVLSGPGVSFGSGSLDFRVASGGTILRSIAIYLIVQVDP